MPLSDRAGFAGAAVCAAFRVRRNPRCAVDRRAIPRLRLRVRAGGGLGAGSGLGVGAHPRPARRHLGSHAGEQPGADRAGARRHSGARAAPLRLRRPPSVGALLEEGPAGDPALLPALADRRAPRRQAAAPGRPLHARVAPHLRERLVRLAGAARGASLRLRPRRRRRGHAASPARPDPRRPGPPLRAGTRRRQGLRPVRESPRPSRLGTRAPRARPEPGDRELAAAAASRQGHRLPQSCRRRDARAGARGRRSSHGSLRRQAARLEGRRARAGVDRGHPRLAAFRLRRRSRRAADRGARRPARPRRARAGSRAAAARGSAAPDADRSGRPALPEPARGSRLGRRRGARLRTAGRLPRPRRPSGPRRGRGVGGPGREPPRRRRRVAREAARGGPAERGAGARARAPLLERRHRRPAPGTPSRRRPCCGRELMLTGHTATPRLPHGVRAREAAAVAAAAGLVGWAIALGHQWAELAAAVVLVFAAAARARWHAVRLSSSFLVVELPILLLLFLDVYYPRARTATDLVANPLDSGGMAKLAAVGLAMLVGGLAFATSTSAPRPTTAPFRLFVLYVVVVFFGVWSSVDPLLTTFRGLEVASAA